MMVNDGSIEPFVSDQFRVGEAYISFCGYEPSDYANDVSAVGEFNTMTGIHDFTQMLAD